MLRLLFWSAVIFAFVMATLPQPPKLPGSPSDKVQHILAFICLAGLSPAAYPRVATLKLAVALSVFGALIEIVQLIPRLHRDAEMLDWFADTAAAASTLLVIVLWRRVRAKAD